MLTKYKKTYKKVAMGLLSLVASRKSVKDLQELILSYEEKPERQLFFWKEGENITGLIGVEKRDGHYVILHLSVNPSYPGEETGYKIIESLRQQMAGQEMRLSRETALFLAKCRNMTEDLMPYREEQAIS